MSTRTIGKSTLVSKDNTAKILRQIKRAGVQATKDMAAAAKLEAYVLYGNDGDGTWKPNEPSTIRWKEHSKVMLGRTGDLSDGIEVRESTSRPGARSVGWFEHLHEDSGLEMGSLATIHEFGIDNPARPWLSKIADNPEHADPVYRAGYIAYQRMMS